VGVKQGGQLHSDEGMQCEACVIVGRDKLVWNEIEGATMEHFVAEIFH